MRRDCDKIGVFSSPVFNDCVSYLFSHYDVDCHSNPLLTNLVSPVREVGVDSGDPLFPPCNSTSVITLAWVIGGSEHMQQSNFRFFRLGERNDLSEDSLSETGAIEWNYDVAESARRLWRQIAGVGFRDQDWYRRSPDQ